MITELVNWFEEAKGSKLQDPNTSEIYTLVDLRRVGTETYFGILPLGGCVKYCNIDRYLELISVG